MAAIIPDMPASGSVPGRRRLSWLTRPREPLYDAPAFLFFMLYVFPIAGLIGGTTGLASGRPHASDGLAVVVSLALIVLGGAYLQRPVVSGRRPWWLGRGDRPETRLFGLLPVDAREDPHAQGGTVPLTPEEVEDTRFRTVRFKEGYDEVEVDAARPPNLKR